MAQVRKLNDASNPFLLPGIAIKTSATERFPIEQALLQRWSKGSWKSFGGLWGYRPLTAAVEPGAGADGLCCFNTSVLSRSRSRSS